MTRRGILLALLCSPLLRVKAEKSGTHYVVVLDDDFCLELHRGDRVIKLGADDIMFEFEPIPHPAPRSFEDSFSPVSSSGVAR